MNVFLFLAADQWTILFNVILFHARHVQDKQIIAIHVCVGHAEGVALCLYLLAVEHHLNHK